MNSSSENLNSLFKEIYLTTVTFVFTFFTLSAYSLFSHCHVLDLVLNQNPQQLLLQPAGQMPRALILFPCTKLLSTWTGKSGGTNNWSRGRLNKWWGTKENDCGHSHTAMHLSMPHLIA